MRKTYKVDVDCAVCANRMEEVANATEGVKEAVLNFMTLKLIVEFEEGADVDEVMPRVVANCKKAISDGVIFYE